MTKLHKVTEAPPGSRREVLKELVKALVTKVAVIGSASHALAQLVNAPAFVVKTVVDVVLITFLGKDSFVLAFNMVPTYTQKLYNFAKNEIQKLLPKEKILKELEELYSQIDLDVQKKRNLINLTYIVLVALVTAYIILSILNLLQKRKENQQKFVKILIKELKTSKFSSFIKHILLPCIIISLIIFISRLKQDIKFKQNLQKEILTLKRKLEKSSHIETFIKRKDYQKAIEELISLLSQKS